MRNLPLHRVPCPHSAAGCLQGSRAGAAAVRRAVVPSPVALPSRRPVGITLTRTEIAGLCGLLLRGCCSATGTHTLGLPDPAACGPLCPPRHVKFQGQSSEGERGPSLRPSRRTPAPWGGVATLTRALSNPGLGRLVRALGTVPRGPVPRCVRLLMCVVSLLASIVQRYEGDGTRVSPSERAAALKPWPSSCPPHCPGLAARSTRW